MHGVLAELVYDVEAFEHECALDRLRRELRAAEGSVEELQQRESALVQERQEVRGGCERRGAGWLGPDALLCQEQAFEFAAKVEQDGREIVARLNENMGIVLDEMSKKEACVACR